MKKIILITLVISCIRSLKNINNKIKNINSELVQAILENDEDKFKALAKECSDLNFTYNGKNLVRIALDQEIVNLRIVKTLIKKEAKLKEEDV